MSPRRTARVVCCMSSLVAVGAYWGKHNQIHQREVNGRAARWVLSSRQGKGLSLCFPRVPVPLPPPSNPPTPTTHARAHTALRFPVPGGKNGYRHFVRGPLRKQQGRVQSILRCHGWCLWYTFIGGDVLGGFLTPSSAWGGLLKI